MATYINSENCATYIVRYRGSFYSAGYRVLCYIPRSMHESWTKDLFVTYSV